MHLAETGLYVATVAALGGGLLYEHSLMKNAARSLALDSAKRVDEAVRTLKGKMTAHKAEKTELLDAIHIMLASAEEHDARLLDYAQVAENYVRGFDATEEQYQKVIKTQVEMRQELAMLRGRLEAQPASQSRKKRS